MRFPFHLVSQFCHRHQELQPTTIVDLASTEILEPGFSTKVCQPMFDLRVIDSLGVYVTVVDH